MWHNSIGVNCNDVGLVVSQMFLFGGFLTQLVNYAVQNGHMSLCGKHMFTIQFILNSTFSRWETYFGLLCALRNVRTCILIKKKHSYDS